MRSIARTNKTDWKGGAMNSERTLGSGKGERENASQTVAPANPPAAIASNPNPPPPYGCRDVHKSGKYTASAHGGTFQASHERPRFYFRQECFVNYICEWMMLVR